MGTKITAVKFGRRDQWGEFQVKAYTAEGRYPAADYYATDLQDARDTGAAMLAAGKAVSA